MQNPGPYPTPTESKPLRVIPKNPHGILCTLKFKSNYIQGTLNYESALFVVTCTLYGKQQGTSTGAEQGQRCS